MNGRLVLRMALVSLVVLAAIASPVLAAKDEEPCCKCADAQFGVNMFTSGFTYMFTGGWGPILILVVLMIISGVVTHLIWGGF